MNHLVYLYGFVPPATPEPGGDLGGLHDLPVKLAPFDDFAGVVSRVPGEEFGPRVLEERMKELAWVAERGVEHERVVTWFVDQGEILPVRLFTLYSSAEALAEEVAARADVIRNDMERFAGLREWDVKLSYDPRRLESRLGDVSPEIAELDRRIADASPGRRYLLEQKRAARAKDAVSDTAHRMADELLEEIRGLARDVVTVSAPARAPELPMVLGAALLLPREDEERVRAVLEERGEELEDRGLHLSLSGPWAPYRFTGRENDREEVADA